VQAAQRRGQKAEYDERILGSGDFITAIFKEVEEKQRRQLKFRRTGTDIEGIIQKECASAGISARELKNGSRRHVVSVTRMRIARRGVEELGLTSAEIARHLGVCTSTITRAIEKDAGEA